MVGPKAKKLAAIHLEKKLNVSERRASKVLGLNRSTKRYKLNPKLSDDLLIKRMRELAAKHRRFGLPRLYYLLNREGLVRSKSRAERVYKSLNLKLRSRKRKKLVPVVRVPLDKPSKPNEVWSFDFIFDQTRFNRRLKCLTVVDDVSKKTPGILVEYSITSEDLTNYFDSLKLLPRRLRCDNGPEMSSRHFMNWAEENNIKIEWIEPGEPIQNAFVESFNGKLRDECLNENIFLDLDDAKKRIESWRRYYNKERPHSSLNYKTPHEFEMEFEQQTNASRLNFKVEFPKFSRQ